MGGWGRGKEGHREGTPRLPQTPPRLPQTPFFGPLLFWWVGLGEEDLHFHWVLGLFWAWRAVRETRHPQKRCVCGSLGGVCGSLGVPSFRGPSPGEATEEGTCSGSGEDLQKVKRLKRNLQIKGCQFHLSLRLFSKSLRDRTSDQGIPGTLGFGRLKHRIAFLRKEAQNHTQKKGESCQTCRPRVLGVLFWHHAPAR